jgi:CheY-like chemotaxis protein
MATAGASVAVLLAVLSVMLGLPYMSGPTLRRLIIGVVLVSAAVGSIELTGDGLMPPPPMPTWALATVLGVAVPATGGLVFLLVLQYSSRLTDTIRQIRAANVELQSSRRRVVNAQEQLRGEVAQQLHGPVQNRLLVVLQWLRMDQADHGADNPDFAIVAEGHDGASAMRLVRDYAPDVLLLDVELPDMHSTQVAEEVHAEHPDVKVVLMSAYYDKAFSEQSGVEYIPKVEFSVSRLREVSGSLLDAGPKGR